jgi:hypothetical protein
MFPRARKQFFGVKILQFFDADPGWRKFGSKIRGPGWEKFGSEIRDGKNSDPGWKNSDPGSGTNIPDPQH